MASGRSIRCCDAIARRVSAGDALSHTTRSYNKISHIFPRRGYASLRMSGAVPGMDSWGMVDASDITIDLLKEQKEARPGFLRYQPAEYLELLREFSLIARNSGADWPLVLSKEMRPPKELLNDLGCYTSELSSGGSWTFFRGPIPLAMFSGASILGCEASCVSLMQNLLMNADAGKIIARPLFRPNAERFRAIVRKGQNPFALFTEGSWLAAQNKPRVAIKMLERAMELGGEDFPWTSSANYHLGRAYHSLGDSETALAFFKTAAEEGYRGAWQWIGRVSSDDSARRDAYFKGGVAGDKEAFDLLGDEFAERSDNESGDREFLKWASEFKEMASPSPRN